MTLESSGGKHHLGGMKNLLVSPPCGRSGQPGLLAGSTTSASGLSVESAISGATIFMTGSTGFVGSVVLEQLMRSCPTFKRIYLLIRARRGQQGEQRLSQLLAKDLFHLHWKDGAVPLDVRNKIAVIAGDMHAPGLGLSDADKQRLLAEVDCVIHCAASISFFEPVHTLLEQNYEATRKTAELAQQMRHLRGFVYVSTAYVNSNLPRGSHIEERIYPLYYSNGNRILHGHLAAQLAALPASKAERLAQDVLRQTALPNCYTLTKHMCEEMLVGLHGVAFPVAIVRPTIVGAVARLPLPGYFGNAAGITSATLAFATGMSRFCCHNPHSVYDVVPCDLTASTILVAAAALQEACVSGAAQPLVLHSGTSCTHPFSYYAMHATVVFPYWSACPPDRRLCSKPYKPIDHPTNFVPERSMIFRAMTLKHNIRIWLVAAGLQVAGQRKTAGLVRASWRVWKLYNTSTMDFHLFYCSRNLVELQGLIKSSEQESWQLVWGPGDDWEKYLLTHMRAIRAKYFPLRAPKEADTPESSAASVVKVQ